MNDVFHTLVRQQRQVLAISEDDVATILSMSWSELYDLEAYADEWRTVVPLFKIKVLAGLLKIDMRQVVGPATNTLELQSLDTFIRARRTELGLRLPNSRRRRGYTRCSAMSSRPCRTGWSFGLRRLRCWWRMHFKYLRRSSWHGF
jgi:hypothetical protein